jgi:hypothetical protein
MSIFLYESLKKYNYQYQIYKYQFVCFFISVYILHFTTYALLLFMYFQGSLTTAVGSL